MIEGLIIFFCAIALAILSDILSKVKDKNQELKNKNDEFRVFSSPLEPQPWQTGEFKIEDGVLYVEWARFDGGDGFNDVSLVKRWRKASPKEEEEYKRLYGGTG
ncbi:hypothetical protein [Sphingobacterium psychroaquaticum]|uniref:Uncharacterized protein n=1 Tax=Sphingobacterium psychroaquaticum TaxID=561061 RepID=A0A1X7K473_9SPHI|nr:hypothetical protein [Sphingobacterium psychroaquaticum]SMG35782.1 hypothetical protein SAMN05660862_2547 [Sphingobacterium psychroaquaticum]